MYREFIFRILWWSLLYCVVIMYLPRFRICWLHFYVWSLPVCHTLLSGGNLSVSQRKTCFNPTQSCVVSSLIWYNKAWCQNSCSLSQMFRLLGDIIIFVYILILVSLNKSKFEPPSSVSFDGNVAENWDVWKQELEL